MRHMRPRRHIPRRFPTLAWALAMLAALAASACLHRDEPQQAQDATGATPGVAVTLELLAPDETRLQPSGYDSQGNAIYDLEEDMGRVFLQATLSSDDPTRNQPLSFDYVLCADTARAAGTNPDYRIGGRTINSASSCLDATAARISFPAATRFQPADNTAITSVIIFADGMDEPDTETFYMVFGNEQGVSLPAQGYIFNIIDADPRPALSLAVLKDGLAQTQVEISESVNVLELELSLSPSSSSRSITVPIRLSGTALPGTDFQPKERFVIEPGTNRATTRLLLSDDAMADGDKTLEITLLPPDFADLGDTTSVTITLRDDEGLGRLNATGIMQCVYHEESEVVPCNDVAEANFPGQDALVQAGESFQFTELEPGNCALDPNTGLLWELKDGQGLRGAGAEYTWYHPYANANGGEAGTVGGTDSCAELENCDTDSYVRRINTIKLCGYDDWRLPKLTELLSLVDFSLARSLAGEPQIDLSSFPLTQNGNYWTATPVAGFPEWVWVVDFRTGQVRQLNKLVNQGGNAGLARIRLVRRGAAP